MRRTVCGKVKLAPHPASVSPMLHDFPLAFAKDLQTGSVDDQMLDFTMGWRFYADTDALCLSADQRLVRAAQRKLQEFKN